ncbi:(2Fe-2S)-binding protein [Aureimonas sp. AU20]|uniref:(2Fe-2S)-binding protein n=1 Tax=Aureimonas sp. AU20 TaxID=1349819 RepID=UPI0007201CA7|nr:(2Fe-2S)-binding protein [Aureimonas sp. AU20]ALN75584.1 hypothetical protein M673_22840 [Aureimonas sp. AU20]
MSVRFELNGEPCGFAGDPLTPLVDILRRERFLTGTKAVCREGFCGACTVHVDGEARMSCLLPIASVAGRRVLTIEGLAPPGAPHPLQVAFEAADVVQCGMCFPGMVMSLSAAFRDRAPESRAEVKAAMTGNICRCTGYERIVDAVLAGLAAERASATESGDV